MGRVVPLMRPINLILGEHPNQWVVLTLSDDQTRGRYVASADSITDPKIHEAIARERAAGRVAALLFSGSLIPEGAIVVL